MALNSGRTVSQLSHYDSAVSATRLKGPKDIAGREDILRLVESFYTKAFSDEVIGYIFSDVVQMNLTEHMPIMADFWQTVLFKAGLYKRNALSIHVAIHAIEPLTVEHFNRWLQLWTATVDELFSGEKAELAKAQAHVIAGSLHRRVTGRPGSQFSSISVRPDATRA